MLVDFRFKHDKYHGFFTNQQNLSMVASEDNRLESNVFDPGKKWPRLLKSALIIGGHGHGKSTIITLLFDFLLSIEQGFVTDRFPAGKYEISFIIENILYSYCVEWDGSKICLEELDCVGFDRKVMNNVFKRSVCENTSEYIIKVGKKFPKYKYLTKLVPPRQSYLLIPDLKELSISELIRQTITVVKSDFSIRNLSKLKNEHLLEKINTFLRELDCGVCSVNWDKNYHELSFGLWMMGHRYDLPIDRLSTGANWIAHRTIEIFDALENGKTLVLDDLGNALHPAVSAKIIEMFHSTETNPKNAQLIFTTNCVSLLKFPFRRDQIWFVESDFKEQTAILYSLASFEEDTTKDRDLEKDYMSGCYGAMPYFS